MAGRVSRRRLARTFVAMLAEQPNRRDMLVRQTAAYLIATKQAHQAHLLINDIASELLKAQGHISAQVQSALPLTPNTRDHIITMLKDVFAAQTAELTEVSAPQLIGGVVVTTPTHQFNTSIAHKLKQIAGGTT